MTNPDSAVGTNAGYDGRTSTKAFNDDLGAFSKGVISGWACAPKTGMTVELGGDGSNRDVAIAEDNAGNRTTINNTSGAPVPITLDASPASGSRYDLIVAYVENPPQGLGATDVDFTSQVGFIAVKGTAAGTPSVPDDTAIRTAITADGATGSTAYYVILAQILVGTNVSTIGSGVITQGTKSQSTLPLGAGAVGTNELANAAVTSAKIDWTTLEQFSPQYTGTRCTARVAKFGKVAFICGTTSTYSWSGTYAAQTFILPAGIVPSGSIALYVDLNTYGQTVDDAQYTHGQSGFTFTSSSTTIGFPLLSAQAASKSCNVMFFIPVKLP